MRILFHLVERRPIQCGIGQVEDQALGEGTRRRADLHPRRRLQFRDVRLHQVPQDIDLAGLDQLLTHLAAGRDPDDHSAQVWLPRLTIVPVGDKGDVIPRDPLQHRERARPDRLTIVGPARHLRGIACGVPGHDGVEPAQERRVERLVSDHHRGGGRTIHRLDVTVPGCTAGPALRIHDGLPGESHVVAGDGLAIRPFQAILEMVGDGLTVAGYPAVLPRGHLFGQEREVFAIGTDPKQSLDGEHVYLK